MKPTILLQLDSDPQPSAFDAVVAIDSGIDHLLQYGGVEPEQVQGLVHGLLFTRGTGDLKRSAVFVGGSNVPAGEAILKAVTDAFFGPFRVSALMDANGANTTAAAAVLASLEGFDGSLQGVSAAVLGGTGPVGQRVARLLAHEGASVSVGSRQLERAQLNAEALSADSSQPVRPFSTAEPDAIAKALQDTSLIISAGAAGVVMLPASVRQGLHQLKVAIDLNAVPPLGIEGIESSDKGQERNGVRAWGALGVGGTKMKIHRKALQELFQSNDRIFDAEEVFALGKALTGGQTA